MPDPEDLLSELRFGGAVPPDFGAIRRRARRRRIRRIAMAAAPLSVIAALVVVPRVSDDGGPPAEVVAVAPNGGSSDSAESGPAESGPGVGPPGPLSPVPDPPATTTATTVPPTISTLVPDEDPGPEVEAGSPSPSAGPADDPATDVDVVEAEPTTTAAPPARNGAGGAAGGAGGAASDPTTTTIPALAVEAGPPLESGPPIRDLASLPSSGFAVLQDGQTVLADADGDVLGHLPSGSSELTFSRPTAVLPANAVTGCQVAEARRTLRVEICPRRVREHGATYDSREVRLSRIDAPSIVVTTPIGRDWYDDPARPVFGQWRSAAVSPDARWMALEWIRSCGAIDSFVVDLAADELMSATRTQWPVSPAAEVLGWTDDDALLLHLVDDPCSPMTATPGVYRFRPADGTLAQLVSTEPDASAQLWSQTPVDQ